MVAAWLITLPSAAVVGALTWWIADLLGGVVGGVAVFLLLCLAAGGFWLRSRTAPVHAGNVNDEWSESPDRLPTAA